MHLGSRDYMPHVTLGPQCKGKLQFSQTAVIKVGARSSSLQDSGCSCSALHSTAEHPAAAWCWHCCCTPASCSLRQHMLVIKAKQLIQLH